MSQSQAFCMCPLPAMQSQSIWQTSLEGGTGQRPGQVLPLALLGAGTVGRISFLRGQSEMVRHMTELGFVEGAEIKVVSGNLGNLIVELKGSRLAIGRQMASHIVVSR